MLFPIKTNKYILNRSIDRSIIYFFVSSHFPNRMHTCSIFASIHLFCPQFEKSINFNSMPWQWFFFDQYWVDFFRCLFFRSLLLMLVFVLEFMIIIDNYFAHQNKTMPQWFAMEKLLFAWKIKISTKKKSSSIKWMVDGVP